MATTAWATADGFYDEGDGHRRPARAELSPDGLSITAIDGEPIALWKSADLERTLEPQGFRLGTRHRAGGFIFDPDSGGDLIRVLARLPDAGAPLMPQALVGTMVTIVAVAIAALFALAWGAFWIFERLYQAGTGPGAGG